MATNAAVVAIASIRRPKVAAVKAVFERLASRLQLVANKLEFLEIEVESGVEETPSSLERIMQGAKFRAANLRNICRQQQRNVSFFVGLEGGFFSSSEPSLGRQTFLQSWAYVSSDGRESFGASGAILLPRSLAESVIDGKESLADVIDRAAKQKDVRSNQGSWGVLSQDLITRQASFEIALTSALAPFYNQDVYRAS